MTNIQTTTSTKQIYRHRFVKYLLSDNVDDIYHLYKINWHLLSIEDLKKKIKKVYEDIKSKHEKYATKYERLGQYRKIIKDASGSTKKEFELKFENLSQEIAQLNPYIIYIFTKLVFMTDLKDMPVLSPTASSQTDNAMSSLVFSEDDN